MTNKLSEFENVGLRTVVMTTPSLDPAINVSGISSVVRGLMAEGPRPETGFNWQIVPAIVGKRDSLRRGPMWLLSQVAVLISFACSVWRHRPDIVHINGPLSRLAVVRDAVLVGIAQLFGKRVVYHLHGGTFVHNRARFPPLHRLIVKALRKPALVVVLSELEAESIVKLYDVERKRIRVLHNAVDVPTSCPDKLDNGPLRVLSIGRLSPEKGLSTFCDAADAHPSWKSELEVRMHGAGKLESEITSRLTTALGPAFRFKGVAGEEEKKEAYAWADVVVMPSIWGEGLPMVLLEAMAAGVVPVATPDGSIPEVVKTGENGLLVEKSSPSSLAHGISEALHLKKSGDLRKLARNAHKTVEKTHSLQVQATELSRIYAEVLQ